ncbi:MAG: 16S rRNA (uracil(1498)-N(3))-methyltransferase [Clostridia bacterium]|nr:16S rRNA (uracil(1498)-N(3))-methyltransferase [Clostridia bacterium]
MCIRDRLITITGEDVKHLRQVLRLEPGEVIGVFDGTGREYTAELLEVDKNQAVAKVLSSILSETEPKVRVTLFQGFPKGEKMDLIIQKAVELGVYEIVPVLTERSVVQLDGKEREKKGERFNKIAREAAKQCRRAYVPRVISPVTLNEALLLCSKYDKAVVLYENEEKKCLKELLKCYTINKTGEIVLFIGPEGGFSPQEIVKLMDHGFDSASLGKRILRAETAAISVLSILMYEMGELQ